jgi:hypothetical protein
MGAQAVGRGLCGEGAFHLALLPGHPCVPGAATDRGDGEREAGHAQQRREAAVGLPFGGRAVLGDRLAERVVAGQRREVAVEGRLHRGGLGWRGRHRDAGCRCDRRDEVRGPREIEVVGRRRVEVEQHVVGAGGAGQPRDEPGMVHHGHPRRRRRVPHLRPRRDHAGVRVRDHGVEGGVLPLLTRLEPNAMHPGVLACWGSGGRRP